MNSKSTVKSLTALTMAGAMVFSMNTMPVSAAKKRQPAQSKASKSQRHQDQRRVQPWQKESQSNLQSQ